MISECRANIVVLHSLINIVFMYYFAELIGQSWLYFQGISYSIRNTFVDDVLFIMIPIMLMGLVGSKNPKK